MQFIDPIINNLFKFDFLIIILAIGATYLYYQCLNSAKKLTNILIPKGNVALGKKNQDQLNAHYQLYLNPKGEHEILKQRQKANSQYVLFTNVVAIFPLMGLLGTIISLIPMVGSVDTSLFYMALTSTFWGIIFAIIFKALNGYLQARMEENNELVQTYLVRKDAYEERHLMQQSGEIHDEI
ncbi:MotA/TolQ/ExbB proton channel family protein [Aerococcaceae bacterium WGS1372]